MPRLTSSTLALACLLVATAAGAGAAERVVIVSNDGQVREARAAETGRTMSRARPAPAAEAGARLDLLANFPSGSSPEESARWAKARPVPGYAGAESVIDKDTRVKVTKTKAYPARAVVQILFSPKGSGASFLCSGNLINADTVVTAGHCIHEGKGGDFYASYTVYPGRNGNSAPFGSCTAKTIYTNNNWISLGGTVAGQKHDYGAIKLNCSIGETTGSFGFFWQSTTLKSLAAIINGYPGDKPSGTQWTGSGEVTVSQKRQTFYSIDTFGGQSGSGVFANLTFDEDTGPYIHSIHAYGVGGAAPGNKNNSGTRITEGVFNFLDDILDD